MKKFCAAAAIAVSLGVSLISGSALAGPTSAPAAAIAKAEARPNRRAPPVISTVFPFNGLSDVTRINGLYLLPQPSS